MRDEAEAGQEVIYFAAGYFWGVEKALWNAPGAVTTATGYMDGRSTNLTHEQACSHSTSHTETVRVVFDTVFVSAADFVRPFFEIHDPTQVGGQGNDIGDQCRSVIWTIMPEQLCDVTTLCTTYQEVPTKRGLSPIQTAIPPVPDVDPTVHFQYAEDHHQQHLFRNPGDYECHTRTGAVCPALPHEQPTRETDTGRAGMCVPACPTSREISSRPGCR